MNNKFEELLSAVKLNDLLSRKEAKKERNNLCFCITAVVAIILSVSAIAFLIYKHCKPDYLEDFEDEFDDDFDDDDFYDDEEELVKDSALNGVNADDIVQE